MDKNIVVSMESAANSTSQTQATAWVGDDHEDLRELVCRHIDSLSPRAREVLQLLSEGYANKQIASVLACSEASVKSHVTAIMKALGCTNRAQIVIVALLSSEEFASRARRRVRQITLKNSAKLAVA